METKPCFKCGKIKALSEFYKHSKMADGHLGKCKICARKDVSENRIDNIDYYRDYDRKRGNRQSVDDLRKYRAKYPGKYRAHRAVNNAVKKGLLFSEFCYECGEKDHVHAHHDDYSKPLNIRWLCPVCHKKWHTKNGEAPNG